MKPLLVLENVSTLLKIGADLKRRSDLNSPKSSDAPDLNFESGTANCNFSNIYREF